MSVHINIKTSFQLTWEYTGPIRTGSNCVRSRFFGGGPDPEPDDPPSLAPLFVAIVLCCSTLSYADILWNEMKGILYCSTWIVRISILLSTNKMENICFSLFPSSTSSVDGDYEFVWQSVYLICNRTESNIP